MGWLIYRLLFGGAPAWEKGLKIVSGLILGDSEVGVVTEVIIVAATALNSDDILYAFNHDWIVFLIFKHGVDADHADVAVF